MPERMLTVIQNQVHLVDCETKRVTALEREHALACVIGIPNEEVYRVEMALRNGRIEAERRYGNAVTRGGDPDKVFQDFSNLVQALAEELMRSQLQAIRAANARVDALRARMRNH